MQEQISRILATEVSVQVVQEVGLATNSYGLSKTLQTNIGTSHHLQTLVWEELSK